MIFKNQHPPEPGKRREILRQAMIVFGLRGFQNATISEIARNAVVGDATIYEYFKSKEDLLLAIPIEVTKEIVPEICEHMMGIKGAFNKLRKFIWWYLNFFEKNPEYASVVLLELKTSRTYIFTEAYQAARAFYQILLDIIKEGQEEGAISKETNCYIARSLCVGVIEHITIRWLLKDKKYSLTQYVDDLTECLIKALQSEETRGGGIREEKSVFKEKSP